MYLSSRRMCSPKTYYKCLLYFSASCIRGAVPLSLNERNVERRATPRSGLLGARSRVFGDDMCEDRKLRSMGKNHSITLSPLKTIACGKIILIFNLFSKICISPPKIKISYVSQEKYFGEKYFGAGHNTYCSENK